MGRGHIHPRPHSYTRFIHCHSFPSNNIFSSIMSTSIHFHSFQPISFLFINFIHVHSLSFISIQLYFFPSIYNHSIHFQPFPPTFIYFHQFHPCSFTFIHFNPITVFVNPFPSIPSTSINFHRSHALAIITISHMILDLKIVGMFVQKRITACFVFSKMEAQIFFPDGKRRLFYLFKFRKISILIKDCKQHISNTAKHVNWMNNLVQLGRFLLEINSLIKSNYEEFFY